MELKDMPNIGPVLAADLVKAGITTPDELRAVGAEGAWLKIRLTVDSGACLHQLQALAGAVAGISKKELTPQRRGELKSFFDSHK